MFSHARILLLLLCHHWTMTYWSTSLQKRALLRMGCWIEPNLVWKVLLFSVTYTNRPFCYLVPSSISVLGLVSIDFVLKSCKQLFVFLPLRSDVLTWTCVHCLVTRTPAVPKESIEVSNQITWGLLRCPKQTVHPHEYGWPCNLVLLLGPYSAFLSPPLR